MVYTGYKVTSSSGSGYRPTPEQVTNVSCPVSMSASTASSFFPVTPSTVHRTILQPSPGPTLRERTSLNLSWGNAAIPSSPTMAYQTLAHNAISQPDVSPDRTPSMAYRTLGTSLISMSPKRHFETLTPVRQHAHPARPPTLNPGGMHTTMIEFSRSEINKSPPQPYYSPQVQPRAIRMPQSPLLDYRVLPSLHVAPAPCQHQLSMPPQLRSPALHSRQDVIRHNLPSEEVIRGVAEAEGRVPPSPPNTLPDFLQAVAERTTRPAMQREGANSIDIDRYWEKKRVQNLLRRLLELLEEKLDKPAPVGASQDVALADATFNSIMQRKSPYRSSLDKEELTEREFLEGLDALKLWPPEMSDADRQEVFLALKVGNSQAVVSLWDSVMTRTLTRVRIRDGLKHVPYNVPDFPVCSELLSSSRSSEEIAAEIASRFAEKDWVGNERVVPKDFYLCGIISLEEIQVSLDEMVPLTLLERAVFKIITEGVRRFSPDDWANKVKAPRMGPDAAIEVYDDISIEHTEPQVASLPAEPIQTVEPESEAEPHYATVQTSVNSVDQNECSMDRSPGLIDVSPIQRPPATSPYRNTAASEQPSLIAPMELESTRTQDPADILESAMGSLEGERRRLMDSVQSTSASRNREPLREEAVTFVTGAAPHVNPPSSEPTPAVPSRAVNWDTAFSGASGCDLSQLDSSHQADQGAGTPQMVAPQATNNANGRNYDEPMQWISLDMHNECKGPYLLNAFVQCCIKYSEAQAHGNAYCSRTSLGH